MKKKPLKYTRLFNKTARIKTWKRLKQFQKIIFILHPIIYHLSFVVECTYLLFNRLISLFNWLWINFKKDHQVFLMVSLLWLLQTAVSTENLVDVFVQKVRYRCWKIYKWNSLHVLSVWSEAKTCKVFYYYFFKGIFNTLN